MDNSLNKKLAEILGKMDEKVLKAKLSTAMDMLKNGDTEQLVKKINKMDKNELMSKLSEIDDSKLKELNLNKDELKQKISDTDLNQLKNMIGAHGDEIVNKIKDILG